MSDAPSCWRSVVYSFVRLKRRCLQFLRFTFRRSRRNRMRLQALPQQVVNDLIPIDEPVPVQVIRAYGSNVQAIEAGNEERQREAARVQVFVPVIPEPPEIPPPPPLPFMAPRKRRHTRPAPTYDLATLIEIKDALDTLENGAQVEIVESDETLRECCAIGNDDIQKTPSKTSEKKKSKENLDSL